MSESDTNEKNYVVTLQDVDGITISGSTYKFNSGEKISLEVKDIIYEYPTLVDIRNRTNRELDSSTTYSSLLGKHIAAGIKPIKVKINGVIWADDLETTRDSGFKPIEMIDLFNFRLYNHKIYLKDYQGSSTNVQTPIYSIENKTDLLGNTIYSSNGLPVVVTQINNIRRGTNSLKGNFISYSIDLEEDR